MYLSVEDLHKIGPQGDIRRACAAWHYTVEVYGIGASDKEGVAARKFRRSTTRACPSCRDSSRGPRSGPSRGLPCVSLDRVCSDRSVEEREE